MSDFVTVKQQVTSASVLFDDAAVADFFDAQVDAGRKPEEFVRIWLHTHPGDGAEPSHTDEETFMRVFGPSDWAVMFILGQKGKTYARLRFNVGPGGQVELPVVVDYGRAFNASDHKAWQAEYEAHVQVEAHALGPRLDGPVHSTGFCDEEMETDWGEFLFPEDIVEQLEAMDAQDRDLVFAELANRGVLSDQESEAPHGCD